MGGRKSRSKGKRVEYEVRDYLRAAGWRADRVPCSGAAQGFKGDVAAYSAQDDKEYKFEVKARKSSFVRIYQLYNELKEGTALYLVWDKKLVSISTDINDLFGYSNFFKIVAAKDLKTSNRILALRGYLKGCDILVIKDNNKPLLFIKYEDL